MPIKKEVFRQGLDATQMANSLMMKALQDQIQTIAEQIIVIEHSVREILQGQQNDRIGLYYSGMALYLEAQGIEDKEMRKNLLAQSLRSLTEATFQLTLTMKADIRYLENKEYESAKGKRVEKIDNRIQKINQEFAIIHQATMLRAGIYCNQNELLAMSTVLKEYSYFIEDAIVKNAELLAQSDASDSGTEEGVWKVRKNLRIDIADFAKQLNVADKTVYLSVAKGTDQ